MHSVICRSKTNVVYQKLNCFLKISVERLGKNSLCYVSYDAKELLNHLLIVIKYCDSSYIPANYPYVNEINTT